MTSMMVQVEGRVEVSLTGPSSKKEVVVVRETSVRVNDGKYHVIRLLRTGAELTLRVDDLQVLFELLYFATEPVFINHLTHGHNHRF
jgi:hypothetical protein